MKELKKLASDKIKDIKLDNYENLINTVDEKFKKLPPYKKGGEIGGKISNLIDKFVDKLLPK